tara:strand:+ start:65 stop:391 length:327 start_codon:yes stop_codon:yes gene_type:complete
MRKKYQFKEVETAFNFKSIPACDQEYLRTMFYQIVGQRSVRNSGVAFSEYYPEADTFTMFDDEGDMLNQMNEYVNPHANTVSHLLHGKKYYMAWLYDEAKSNELVTVS